jgi:nitrogen PTS system EIIA component
MRLDEFLEPAAVSLDLGGAGRDDVLRRLVGLLGLGDGPGEAVVRLLVKRETLGSTGFGRGVALPHCRTLAVNRLRVAFGLHREGVDFGAVDGRPVHTLFLIVAPPMELSNHYLPVLGRIAQLLHEPDIPDRLRALASPEELFGLIAERGL